MCLFSLWDFFFLVACTRLCKSLGQLVGRLVSQSVGWLVGRLVGQLVGRSVSWSVTQCKFTPKPMFVKSNNHHSVVYLGKAVSFKPKKIKNRGRSQFVAVENSFPTVIWFLIFEFFVAKLQPTKVTWSEFPKSSNHHTVVYLRRAVTSKPKKIENRGRSHFVAIEKFFPTVIWFIILKFFLAKLQLIQVDRSEFPKSSNNLQNRK